MLRQVAKAIPGVAIFGGRMRGAMATLGGTPVFRAGLSVAMLDGGVLPFSSSQHDHARTCLAFPRWFLSPERERRVSPTTPRLRLGLGTQKREIRYPRPNTQMLRTALGISGFASAAEADLQALDINKINVAITLRIEVVALRIDDRWPGAGEAG